MKAGVMTAKIVVTELALMARLNRKLKRGQQVVKKFRPGSAEIDRIGAYCLVDTISGSVIRGFTNLAEIAQEFRVLKSY